MGPAAAMTGAGGGRARIALAAPARNGLTAIALGCVWLAVATSSFVFTEPAPTDALTIGLVGLLPMLGLVRFRPFLIVYLFAWLVVVAANFFAASFAFDMQRATVHTVITLYLVLAGFVFAGFVARHPDRHTRLLLNAYLVAALFAAVIGLIGYFDALPGAGQLFTRFDRATATFKDPNVFGPFLVPAMIYTLHQMMTRSTLRSIVPALLTTVLGLALVLSFSRGAWANFAVAVVIYLSLVMAVSRTNLQQIRISTRVFAIAIVALLAIIAAVQHDEVARLLEQRLTLFQTYDVGPEGRFGGQSKAVDLILQHPLGLGAFTFALAHHHEDAHNVFLSMFLSGGWIGGLFYLGLTLISLIAGLAHAVKRTPTQGLFLVIYAAFAGVALEGVIVDTDHWRHFFLFQGMMWGLMSLPDRRAIQAVAPRRAARLCRALPAPFAHALLARDLHRPARITGVARRRLPRNMPIMPRRVRTSRPRRQPRTVYR